LFEHPQVETIADARVVPVAACVLPIFSPRRILPYWLDYHAQLGVAQFHLYYVSLADVVGADVLGASAGADAYEAAGAVNHSLAVPHFYKPPANT
jgi:hypothetical protein